MDFEIQRLGAFEWLESSLSAPPTRLHTMADDSNDPKKLYIRLTLAILAVLVGSLVWFVFHRDWENVFLTAIVIGLIVVPAFVLRQNRIYLPPEFQLTIAAFIFLSLFLGSATDLYYEFWWWDMVLHTGAGFLMGIVGFLTLFLLNQTDRLPHGIRPGFLCFFGFTFAVFLSVVWEIFEYTVDNIAPSINMQSNETGVDDTMHDLIVSTIGALVVALMGWSYFKTGKFSFIADGVRLFVRRNPRLFKRLRRRKRKSKT